MYLALSSAIAEPQAVLPAQASFRALHRSYVERILRAPVYDIAIETPLQSAPRLSAALGSQVLLKREDLQPVHSFKIRGAYARVAALEPQARSRGVITASAGNHAQGLAAAAQKLNIKAIIVMPLNTPAIKVQGVHSRGAEVILYGDTFAQSLAYAIGLAETRGHTFVPPYDDADVIAGQGTVGLELLRQHQGRLDAIFVPVGGGGLIAGIAAYVKYLRPEVRIIGVEPAGSNCLQAALAAGRRVILPEVDTFADGVAVAQVGALNFELCRQLVDEVITVSTDQICTAVRDIYEDTRAVAEPAGALAVAGIRAYASREGFTGQVLIGINSGANIDFAKLGLVAERARRSDRERKG
ncbi:MAG: threonine ammonia-lyase, biosynthetic [Pseudomonas sp.]|nr:threonine ammonia-lyase, biosynthetic [Pseudomonas sp.]